MSYREQQLGEKISELKLAFVFVPKITENDYPKEESSLRLVILNYELLNKGTISYFQSMYIKSDNRLLPLILRAALQDMT